MRQSYIALRQKLTMDDLVKIARKAFAQLPDLRKKRDYGMVDIASSALAMFLLKYPSVLRFEQQTSAEQANLHQIFGIKKVCSDYQLRNILDQVDPEPIRELYPLYFKLWKRLGFLPHYRVEQDHLLVSVDGVEHFHSCKVRCEHCLERRHRNGETSYSHRMLAAVLVHPDQREVLPLAAEAIVKQDGTQKNDCELAASERLLDWMAKHYRGQRLLLVEDALYANAPHLRRILGLGWNFIVNVKPSGQELLFQLFETRKAHGAVRFHFLEDKKQKLKHRFWFTNDMPLNGSAADLRVNFLYYEQEDAKGNVTRFSWATSLPLHVRSVERIMHMGRARWKIENETFNTLKNQGYCFEHNYGHGFKHLATGLAFIMLLAFLIDQIFQATSQLFQAIWKKTKTKARLWESLRGLFHLQTFQSFNELYVHMAALYKVQLE